MPKIESAEAEVARLEAELADFGLYASRGAEVPALNDALEAARGALDALRARWEELEQKKSRGGVLYTGRMPEPRVEIRYCTKCRFIPRASWLSQELLFTFGEELGEVALVP